MGRHAFNFMIQYLLELLGVRSKMLNLQFHHDFDPTDNRGGVTTALEVPTKKELLDKLKVGGQLQIKVGRAECSPKDAYCKKTGRKLCLERLQSKTAKFKAAIVQENDSSLIVLFSLDDTERLIEFKIHKDSDEVYFLRG